MCRKMRKRKKQTTEKDQSAVPTDMSAVKRYEPFLPVELLAIMGMEQGTPDRDESSGEQKELQAVILNANVMGFQELIHGIQIQEVYRFINQTLSLSIPPVYENNGFVESFRDAGITALFPENGEEALQAAVLICEAVIQAADQELYRNFGIGLCRGSVMAGVAGYGRKRCVLTLSAHMGLSGFLQRVASKYSARILATADYVENVKGFAKAYNHRLLGYFYIQEMGCVKKIFDIFDGDETAVRNRKRKTRMLFEKGVGLFVKREFTQARGYFIEVLKADREDRAAGEYVFLCDRYRGMPVDEAACVDIFIETC